jgi:hypothetical protein
VKNVAIEIAEALSQLLGKDVEVQAVDSDQPMEVLVRYVDGDGRLVSAWTMDPALALSMGAALTMIPVDMVNEAMARGGEDPQLDENFREVVNVLSTIPATLLQRRSVLESVTRDTATLQRTARQVSAAGGRWSVLDILVPGYPSGRVAVSMMQAESD